MYPNILIGREASTTGMYMQCPVQHVVSWPRGVLTSEIGPYSFSGLLDGQFAVPGPSGLNEYDDIHIFWTRRCNDYDIHILFVLILFQLEWVVNTLRPAGVSNMSTLHTCTFNLILSTDMCTFNCFFEVHVTSLCKSILLLWKGTININLFIISEW